jgi:hypothetical protein
MNPEAENMKNAGGTQALVKLGDLFQVTVSSDRFAPRVKSGEQLIMATGVIAEEGDVVAMDPGEFDHPKLEFYAKDMPYFAVEIFRIPSKSRLMQNKEKRA